MPTALDNGQRSPRKLLRAVVARVLGGRRQMSGTEGSDATERVASRADLIGVVQPGQGLGARLMAEGTSIDPRPRG
jgi:hypothetical protein